MRALLIQKDVKPVCVVTSYCICLRALLIQKDVKRLIVQIYDELKFESFVNSERCKTPNLASNITTGLRALLIQKDVKLIRYDHW